jgi:dipeptidyl aminopeptidase/acylaminoacyl peptidase
MIEYFSNELQVKADTPPAILIHSDDDSVVLVENSVNYYLALRKYNIPASLHVWEDGDHGYGLAKNQGSVKDWLKICENWLIQRKLIKY